MRQHVNPLSRFFQISNPLPRADELFEKIQLPIHLDIGSARGKFLIAMASLDSESNYLGVEIRESLVDAAEKERVGLGLNNLRFLFCNANVSLEDWFASLQGYPVTTVSIQFPDPWFKNRHKKRRLLTPDFLFLLAKNLAKGSILFIQSDVFSVMEEMISIIDSSIYFDGEDIDLKLVENPFEIRSEREKYAIQNGLDIYRKIYLRNAINVR